MLPSRKKTWFCARLPFALLDFSVPILSASGSLKLRLLSVGFGFHLDSLENWEKDYFLGCTGQRRCCHVNSLFYLSRWKVSWRRTGKIKGADTTQIASRELLYPYPIISTGPHLAVEQLWLYLKSPTDGGHIAPLGNWGDSVLMCLSCPKYVSKDVSNCLLLGTIPCTLWGLLSTKGHA